MGEESDLVSYYYKFGIEKARYWEQLGTVRNSAHIL